MKIFYLFDDVPLFMQRGDEYYEIKPERGGQRKASFEVQRAIETITENWMNPEDLNTDGWVIGAVWNTGKFLHKIFFGKEEPQVIN